MIEQTERRGARPPGLEPDVRKKKKSLASNSGFFSRPEVGVTFS